MKVGIIKSDRLGVEGTSEQERYQARGRVYAERMKRNPQLRSFPGADESNVALSQDALDALVRQVEKPFVKWIDRETALWILGTSKITPDQQARVTRTLVRVVESTNGAISWQQAINGNVRNLMAGAVGFALIAYCNRAYFTYYGIWDVGIWNLVWGSGIGAIVVGGFTLPLMLPLSVKMDARQINRMRTASIEAINRLSCVGGLGTVAIAMLDRDRNIRQAAEKCLCVLLRTKPCCDSVTTEYSAG